MAFYLILWNNIEFWQSFHCFQSNLLCDKLCCAVWENSYQKKDTGKNVGQSSNLDFDLFYLFTSYLCLSSNVECTLCKEENDCSVYILKRTVQYWLLRNSRLLGISGLWTCDVENSRILECRSNKCEYSGVEDLSRDVQKKLLCLKTSGFRTTQLWLTLLCWRELFAQVFQNFPRYLSCALQKTL